MKLFIDTNVWLAGRFGHGLCAQLLDALFDEGDHEVLLDERVRAEFRRIALTKFKVDPARVEAADAYFVHHATLLPAAEEPTPGVPDPDDAWVIAAALTARADAFVTGDQALLDLGAVAGLPLVSPRTAYQRLRGLG